MSFHDQLLVIVNDDLNQSESNDARNDGLKVWLYSIIFRQFEKRKPHHDKDHYESDAKVQEIKPRTL